MKSLSKEQKKRISKRLSYVLRHHPSSIGLTLDQEGWTKVDELLQALKKHGLTVTPSMLKEVVDTNDKKRFAFSPDGLSIRANQGHSIDINLGLDPKDPPVQLYHGTATRHLDSIKATGLEKRNRQHVHLSPDEKTALKVGGRHGKPVILIIRALAMHQDGYPFFESKNGVWLTDEVPVKYIEFPD
ncbi:MAG: RNA 2'-phosphotransferase [Flammeovirgaceae bacterium]